MGRESDLASMTTGAADWTSAHLGDAPAGAPCCPVTGLPAMRRIQTVSNRALMFMWRVQGGGNIARQLAAVPRFSLWESPCGLAFFDPMIAGDEQFYARYYAAVGHLGSWSAKPSDRSDYRRAAALIKTGQSVLDVGCGLAAFAQCVPHARYVGLERSAVATNTGADIRHETLERHSAAHAAEYDAVCAFHVLEHVTDPVLFVADMLRCLRPGGSLMIAVPGWPGAATDIPNFADNAPPHHLTWWSRGAMAALAERLGLDVVSIEHLPCSPGFGIAYWMAWAAPKLTGQRFFRHAWSWYLALLWSFVVGWTCSRLRPLPRNSRSYELMLIARKPTQ
jgi:SAM-dependent methyltransferase